MSDDKISLSKKDREELELLEHKLEWEGEDYCLSEYSDWKEIEAVDAKLYKSIVEYKKKSVFLEQIRARLSELLGR